MLSVKLNFAPALACFVEMFCRLYKRTGKYLLTSSRKSMSAMDVVTVLTKVVHKQHKTIGELQKEIDELKKK